MKTNEPTALLLEEDEARVRALCEPLRSAPVPVTDAETARAERDMLLPFLAERIQQIPVQRDKARRARRWGLGLAAAAAVLVAGGVTAWLRYAPAELEASTVSGGTRGSRSGAANDLLGGAFKGEAAVSTPKDSSARVVTEGGVLIDVAPATRARVASNPSSIAGTTAKIDLMDGSVTLDVPPQAPGSSVRVLTFDATVTVHGTHFTVTYDAAAASPKTCVRVEHGKVSVERRGAASEMLVDGESSGCDVETTDAAIEEPAPKTERVGRSGAHGSTLAQENALLQQALAAEQSGDLKRAEDKLRSLLVKYPHSTLSKEAGRALARVEKERAER